jgi:hypothetical protein
VTNRETDDGLRQIEASDYVAPVLRRKAFHCPHCGVYAQQGWGQLKYPGQTYNSTHISRGECFNCHKFTYWMAPDLAIRQNENPRAMMVYPFSSLNAPPPHSDFPPEPKTVYEEARAIVDRSPRGAVALLRLAVQKLCAELGEDGKNINADIASMVQKGLDRRVQQAFDALRVIGNNAVHPGQIDLSDDRETAITLFGLLNFIVEQQITRPKELQAIYGQLPASALGQIQERDRGGSQPSEDSAPQPD